MAAPAVMQKSFHAGEWAPALNARVDLAKYHSAARTLENFFVDYRGGVSSRMGTKYVLQCRDSSKPVRLIPFAASTTVQYIMEFGDLYIRFYLNGAPVLETGIAITGVTQANPAVVSVANTYAVGDWVYISGIVGMTQLNGRYFKIIARAAGTITLGDFAGNNINSTGYTAWSSGGTVKRVYTIQSPYAAADLALLKFAQNHRLMVFCHPSYNAYALTYISATNWTMLAVAYGASILAPTGGAVATTAAGGGNIAYVITSVDANGQESAPSTALNIATTASATVTISWTARSGALSYNIYRSPMSTAGAVPAGSLFGYIGYSTGVSFVDFVGTTGTGYIIADYSITPPIAKNPFLGGELDSILVTAPGAYTTAPNVIIAAPSVGITATAYATITVTATAVAAGGALYVNGDIGTLSNGMSGVITAVAGAVTGFTPTNPLAFGVNSGNTAPANPVAITSTFSGSGAGATLNLTWGVTSITLTNPGNGYSSAPAVTFSAGAATATAIITNAAVGNPSVPVFHNQRLVLAAPVTGPNKLFASVPGYSYNFNIRNPLLPSDAIINATLTSKTLNTIKALIPMQSGLIVFSDQAAWLVNGGSSGAPISATDLAANSQAYNGCSDVPPIVANFDILYVQSKGSIIRDLTYNFYTNVFTGTDISVLSSHLFYGYNILEWAFCEEPFKVVWAVRDDGTLLSLTFLKEQELIGWTHHVTDGDYKSVASIVEDTADLGLVDAMYCVVERNINGSTVKYIERMAERIFPNGLTDAICVDSALVYSGSATTSFQGGESLAGETVTGLADGVKIAPFVMPTTGFFTLTSAASKVTIGQAFTPILQTLPLDLGEPTVQGMMKKISSVTIRAQDTLGLWMGTALTTIKEIQDFKNGEVNRIMNQVVSGLFTGDGEMIIDPKWATPGQYYITQPNPYPCTILGVIPEVSVGETGK